MSDATERAQHLRHQRRILPVLATIIGLLLVANLYMVWQERQQLIAQSAQVQQSLVHAMADRLQATLQKTSILAALLADDLLEQPHRVTAPAYRARLLNLAKENPEIDQIALLDADGNSVVSAVQPLVPHLNFRDREYFWHHLATPGNGLRIGEPLVSRATRKRAIPVTRRITDRQGRFAGVVVITLDSAVLLDEFKALRWGPHGFVAINHLDGRILSRQPADPAFATRDMRGTDQHDDHYRKLLAGSFIAISPIDGLQRRYTFKRLVNFPLLIIAGISDDDLLGEWVKSTLLKLGYAIALSVSLALVALYLYRKLGRLLQAESESQNALARVQTYQTALDDYVNAVLIDADGVVLEANDRFCGLSGFDRSELVGRRFPVLDGRIDDPDFATTLRLSLQAGASWRGVRLARSKRGDGLWLNACLLPLPAVAGEPRRFLLAQVDITSLKTGEERMAAANEELNATLMLKRAILASAPSAIIASDAGGRIVMFNAAAETLLGYSGDEAKDGLSPVIFHDPDEVAAALQMTLSSTDLAGLAYAELMPALASDPNREWTYRRRDGSVVAVQLRVSPLRRKDGTVSGHVTIATDLSQQKQLDRMKSDFVSVVSHELRTPLTSIKGAIAIVNASLSATATPQQAKLMGMATDSCDRLVRLVSDILDLDKLSRGQMPLNQAVRPLQALLEKAMQMNEPYAASQRVTLRLSGLSEALRVRMDSDRMLQVMTNLLSNASKFSAAGGEVRICLTRAGDTAVIAVEDDGCGIPAPFHARVFEPFTQSDAAGTRRNGGSGLGLSIAKAYVDAHGGSLTFESTESVGTTFYLRLPLAELAAPQP